MSNFIHDLGAVSTETKGGYSFPAENSASQPNLD